MDSECLYELSAGNRMAARMDCLPAIIGIKAIVLPAKLQILAGMWGRSC